MINIIIDKELWAYVEWDYKMNLEQINKVINAISQAEDNLLYYRKKIQEHKNKSLIIIAERERKKKLMYVFKSYIKRKLSWI